MQEWADCLGRLRVVEGSLRPADPCRGTSMSAFIHAKTPGLLSIIILGGDGPDPLQRKLGT